jgi:hypothetical protein
MCFVYQRLALFVLERVNDYIESESNLFLFTDNNSFIDKIKCPTFPFGHPLKDLLCFQNKFIFNLKILFANKK